MQMWMQVEFLSPGVQDGEEANLSFEVLPAGRRFEKRLRGGSEQQVVDHGLVLQRQGSQFVGQGKYHMKVFDGEQVSLSVLKPLRPQAGLAFWTVAIMA